jgi:hypothetical protein
VLLSLGSSGMAVVRAARGDPNADGQQQEGRRAGGLDR